MKKILEPFETRRQFLSFQVCKFMAGFFTISLDRPLLLKRRKVPTFFSNEMI